MRRSGPAILSGIRTDAGMGIQMLPEIEPDLMKRIERLPAKVGRSIRRRSLRQALTVFKKIAVPLYRKHRSNINRKHLDQSLAVVTRTYRKGKRTTYWGAMGFRMGAVKSKGRVLQSTTKLYENDWAGWRAHFLERGFTATGKIQNTKTRGRTGLVRKIERQRVKNLVAAGFGRRVEGREYLPKVLAIGRGAAREAFSYSIAALIRSEGRKGWRMPRPFLASELRQVR